MSEAAEPSPPFRPQPGSSTRVGDSVMPIHADEVAGVLAARRTLGPEAEDAVIASFLDRVGRTIDERVDRRMAEHSPRHSSVDNALWLGLGSIGLGIPITGVISTMPTPADAIVTAVAWAAIAVVNVTYNRRNR
jgi:hypothetical protein